MSYEIVLGYARKLRKNPTKAEKYFWIQVRRRNILGMKFTRQFIVRYFGDDQREHFYIADFHCHQKKLIVEIDGAYHNQTKQIEYDRIRDEILIQMGYTVLRFKNEDVLNNWNIVLEKLKKHLI